jgi:hypothetical protein
MMDLSWPALLFLSLSWLGLSGVYGEGFPFVPCVLIGVILAALSLRAKARGTTHPGNPQRRNASRTAGNIARATAKCAALGAIQCAVVLLVQAFVFPFAHWFFSRQHAESIFAALSGRLLALCGLSPVVEGSDVYFTAAFKTVVFSSAWEKTGALFFVTALCGGFALLALKAAGVRKYIFLTVFTVVYAVLRYTLLLLLYASYQLHSLFWSPAVTLATLLPYALFLAYLLRGEAGPSPARLFALGRDKTAFAAAVIAFASVLSSTAFFAWHDAGREKAGRVLVEEYHSNWEWTDEAYDENWFGERSGYNYYCFYEYIGKFYQVSRNTTPLNRESLANTDVLILKTPTEPYADDELAAICDYVEDGGGLYLIGDHTNVFGTGSNLNQVAAAFGLSFNYDCTYELARGSLSEYDAPLLLPHPAVAGLPHFLFATSCTLDTSWLAEEIITGCGLKNLPADYSQDNFFPADLNSGRIEFGAFVQCASAYFGKGRVIAFTDSTVYSNFWMHMLGKPELLLKNLQWLNRENVMPIAPRAIAAAALLLSLLATAVLAVLVVRGGRPFPAGAFFASGAASFLLGAVVFGLQAHAPKQPEPIQPIVNICFEEEYSSALLPKDLKGFLSDADRQISTFYVWTQRLGCVPSLRKNLKEALDEGDIAVVVKPDKPLRDVNGILERIEQGATLLLLYNASGSDGADALLKRADMAVEVADMTGFADFGELKDIPLTPNAVAVAGGTPLISDAAGNAVLSVKHIGEGLLAVFSDPDLFFNMQLGEVSSNLTDKTRLLTQVEFRMLRELLRGNPAG